MEYQRVVQYVALRSRKHGTNERQIVQSETTAVAGGWHVAKRHGRNLVQPGQTIEERRAVGHQDRAPAGTERPTHLVQGCLAIADVIQHVRGEHPVEHCAAKWECLRVCLRNSHTIVVGSCGGFGLEHHTAGCVSADDAYALSADGRVVATRPTAQVDGVSTLDLVASRWTLLVGAAGERWLAAAPPSPLPLLVRPDAIVAMRVTAPCPDPARFLADVLDQVLARPVAVPST